VNYLWEVWRKSNWQLSPVDEILLFAEVAVAILLIALTCCFWEEMRKPRRR
jgi:hypothetical protein